jgi:hypothetical protein
VVVEVQADRVHPFVRNSDPVGARGVSYEKVISRRALEERLVGHEPPQVVGHLFGVAKDGVIRAQGAQEVDERDRGAHGVPVGDGVSRNGRLLEPPQEICNLLRRVIFRWCLHHPPSLL